MKSKATTLHEWLDRYFWGTGRPEEAAKILVELLGMFRRRPDSDAYYLAPGASDAFDANHGVGMYNFIAYLLCGQYMEGDGIVEFGTAVWQCWLTPLGEEVKRFVEEHPEDFWEVSEGDQWPTAGGGIEE